MKKTHIASAVAMAAVAANAGFWDKDDGIKVCNDRLTLSPYVSLSYTYDSNIDSGKHSKSGSQWSVSPVLGGKYKGDNWDLTGSVFYRYVAYNRYVNQLNTSSYGESLRFSWDGAGGDEPGWRVEFGETFTQIAQDDDMSSHDGRGMGRDCRQIDFDGVVERRINQKLHAAATASYYMLDYDNDVDKYAPMYGWKRFTLGGQAGYVASPYTDIIFAGDYQWYKQDNDSDRSHSGDVGRGRRISSDSRGLSLMAGLGTHATERIEYRALFGWSRFEYGNGTKDMDGWTYRVSAKWQVDVENTLNVMLIGNSYYQPSERDYGSAIKVYMAGLGVTKSIVRRDFSLNANLTYRRETSEYADRSSSDYDEDIITARIGFNYKLCKRISAFANVEYQTEETSNGHGIGHSYDYDRWRGTVGMRLSY